jgi:predicted ATP-dependent Lon-type protease
MKVKLDDLKTTLTHMKSALQEPDTHAADFATLREALKRFEWISVVIDSISDGKMANNAIAALDRLEGRNGNA